MHLLTSILLNIIDELYQKHSVEQFESEVSIAKISTQSYQFRIFLIFSFFVAYLSFNIHRQTFYETGNIPSRRMYVR